MALRVEQRGFQWANIQSRDVIFWHYDISNEGTTVYDYNVIFGLYMDSGVGGGSLSPFDLVYESDDDNAYYDTTRCDEILFIPGIIMVMVISVKQDTWVMHTWKHLEILSMVVDNDDDGIVDEKRDGGPGEKIVGQGAILNYIAANYDTTQFK